MRISDWSSDVCSSDLARMPRRAPFDASHRVEPRTQGIGREEQFVGRQYRPFQIVPTLLVTLGGLCPEAIGGVECVAGNHHQGVGAEVIEQALRAARVEKQR